MSVIKKGKVHDVTTAKSISVDEFGIVTQSITKSINNSNTTSADAYTEDDFLLIGSSSPDYSKLLCTDVSLSDSDVVKSITITYKGALESSTRYRISAQGSQEPIQVHPAFNDTPAPFSEKLAGTGADPQNGAIFKGNQENSEFDYFPIDADHDLGGVTGFLSPTVELEKITVQSNTKLDDPDWVEDDIYKIADIVDPSLTLNVGQRTWLLMGSTQEVIGGAVKSTAIYRLSGVKGWNEKIYTTSQ